MDIWNTDLKVLGTNGKCELHVDTNGQVLFLTFVSMPKAYMCHFPVHGLVINHHAYSIWISYLKC